MIRRLLVWPYRIWLRHDLKWINDRIADEKERHARHALTLRNLNAEAADLRWKLGMRHSRGCVIALLPRDNQRVGNR